MSTRKAPSATSAMSITAPSRSVSLLFIAAAIFISLISLAAYAGLFSPLPTPVQTQISLPGLPNQTAEILAQSTSQKPGIALSRLLPIISIFSIFVAATAAIVVFLLSKLRQKKRRDKVRLQHLELLSQTFELYFNQHGHYPMSATYDPQYYSAINILTEWSSYNFPPTEEMRHFWSDWPPSDPAFNATAPEQAGNYLYYPHHFGQRFSLYAQLESPKQHPIPDYNTIDKLPPTIAKYNYRLNGPDHHQEPTAQTASHGLDSSVQRPVSSIEVPQPTQTNTSEGTTTSATPAAPAPRSE